MRMSDWNCELKPSACATAGTSTVFAGARPSFGVGVTAVTILTETGTVDVVVPRTPFEDAWTLVTVTVASVEPTSSTEVWIVRTTFAPSGGSGPLDGVTVINGLSIVTAKVSVVSSAFFPFFVKPPMNRFCVNAHDSNSVHGLLTRLKLGFVAGTRA